MYVCVCVFGDVLSKVTDNMSSAYPEASHHYCG